MAAVISVASAKGGCGKTTTTLLVAAELALDGYQVTVLDGDINQHGAAFAERAAIPGLSVVGGVNQENLLDRIGEAEAAGAEAILVDLPGGTSTLSLMAMQRSNLVLIPCRLSLPDARDAARTIAMVDAAAKLVRVPIPRALVWAAVPSGFESRSAKLVRETMENDGVPTLSAGLLDRAIFREMHITGQVPRQIDPAGAAAANVTAVTQEILKLLKGA